jgi:hypothetical protein
MILQRPDFEFTVPMALEDFIPVIFTAVGLYFLLKVIIRRYRNLCGLACLGATLVITDGFLKAFWKLIYAASGTDIAWMKDSLFVLMGPGFIFVSWALWRGLKEQISTNRQIWLTPLAIVLPSLCLSLYLAMNLPDRSWARILLMLTTIGIFFTNGQVIYSCVKKKLYLPIIMLLITIITIFTQVYISQLQQTTAIHWIGQVNNTVSQAGFATGIWLWQRYLHNSNDSHD